MPSTRMIPPRPNQARRKALSFLLCSLALASSSWLTNAGFSTGVRLIMEALSLLSLCFLLVLTVLGPALVELDLVGATEDGVPNPSPGEVDFLGAGDSLVDSVLEVVFWDWIVNLGLDRHRRRGAWRR